MRIGQKIVVSFGKPIDFTDLRIAYAAALEEKSSEKQAIILAEANMRIVQGIQTLKNSLQES